MEAVQAEYTALPMQGGRQEGFVWEELKTPQGATTGWPRTEYQQKRAGPCSRVPCVSCGG